MISLTAEKISAKKITALSAFTPHISPSRLVPKGLTNTAELLSNNIDELELVDIEVMLPTRPYPSSSCTRTSLYIGDITLTPCVINALFSL